MSICRIRVGRETPVTGKFEWAALDDRGAVLQSGSSNLAQPPVTGECEVIVDSELVLLKRVAVPELQQRRLSSALHFLVEDDAIPDPERLHVAAAPARSKDALCVAVVDRQWLAQTLSRLERAGLVARSAYPECLLPELPARAWAVVWSGDQSFVRTGSAEGFVLDRADRGEVPHSLRLALAGAGESGTRPQTIQVRPAAGLSPPDTGQWAETLGIPVTLGPAWHWADAAARPDVDLLQGEFARRRVGGLRLRRLRRSAALAAALLLLASLGIAADWAAKARERRQLHSEMQAIYRETFGERAVVVDAPLQMRRALADLRQGAGQPGPSDFVSLLGPVAERFLDPTKQRIEEIRYENGVLTVSLRPHDAAQGDTLLAESRARTPPRGLDVHVERAAAEGRAVLRLVAKVRTKP
jgi:general secretion pathway protein L